MTEDLRRFCNRLETLLISMAHREEIEVHAQSSIYGKGIYNHTVRIVKHASISDLPPCLELIHTVRQNSQKVMIETFKYNKYLMLDTSYFWGYGNIPQNYGINVEDMEFIDRLRLFDEDSLVDFDDLLEQIDLHAVDVL